MDKEYTFKYKAYSFEECEFLRKITHENIIYKIENKGIVISKISSQFLFDPMKFECIVKVGVYYG